MNEIFIVSLFHVPRSLLIRSFIILSWKFDPSGGTFKALHHCIFLFFKSKHPLGPPAVPTMLRTVWSKNQFPWVSSEQVSSVLYSALAHLRKIINNPGTNWNVHLGFFVRVYIPSPLSQEDHLLLLHTS